MNIQQAAQILINSGIEPNEAIAEVKIALELCMGLNSTKLALNPDFEPSKDFLEKLNERAKTKKPIQYILGKAYFMYDYYKVDENVLIPRDDTEILVQEAIKCKGESFLDIGAGSGIISPNWASSLTAFGSL